MMASFNKALPPKIYTSFRPHQTKDFEKDWNAMDSHVANSCVLLATLVLIKKGPATALMFAKSVLQVTQAEPKI